MVACPYLTIPVQPSSASGGDPDSRQVHGDAALGTLVEGVDDAHVCDGFLPAGSRLRSAVDALGDGSHLLGVLVDRLERFGVGLAVDRVFEGGRRVGVDVERRLGLDPVFGLDAVALDLRRVDAALDSLGRETSKAVTDADRSELPPLERRRGISAGRTGA